MPGFEVIGAEEKAAINEIFEKDHGILFAHGFDALRNNRFRVREFEKAFASRFECRHAQAVTSGSAALLVGLKALGIGPGDEVITQCFTFVATVEAILMLGAIPVITEIDGTFNMDPVDLEKQITARTRAIVPVHMAGVPARMTEIMRIARDRGIPVLEDNAQGIGTRVGGRYCGTIGDAGAFSLDFGKTITTGEGGMLLMNSEDVYREALAFHDHGHEYNPKLGRADDTRHSWGLNFRMSELNAAVGLEQLKKLDFIIESSCRNKQRVKDTIKDNLSALRFREIPEDAEENYDSLYVIFETAGLAARAVERLRVAGLGTKNVPDALRWHFAGTWEHMFSEVPAYRDAFATAWPRSTDLLSRTVALPIMVRWDDAFLDGYLEKLLPALRV